MPDPKPAYLSERWSEPPPPRVLIVDDDAGIRRATARALSQAGLEVVAVESGAAALATLEVDDPFDALVTDLEMPGMSGLELVRRVRERWPELPAGIFSASEELGHVSRADLEGVRFVKQKAHPIGALIAAIYRAVYAR